MSPSFTSPKRKAISAAKSRPTASAVNELEAYLAEREIAPALGLSEHELGVVNKDISILMQQIQGTEYASRVSAGNFKIFPSDLMTGP